MSENVIITITGPSCAGKSTLEEMLKTQHNCVKVVSTTTRAKRPEEVNGESYYFVSKEEFTAQAANDEFVEMIQFNDESYGITETEFERVFAAGKPVVVVVEPDGHKQVLNFANGKGWRVFSVFVCNPAQVIADRFMKRFIGDHEGRTGASATKSVEAYSKRLALMLSTELGWQFEANITKGLYNLHTFQFDESNAPEVVDVIRRHGILGELIPEPKQAAPTA